MKYAIPSYHRHRTLPDQTLAVLNRLGVSPRDITVFVADQDEADRYSSAVGSCNLVVAAPGMGAVRRFIVQHFAEGEEVVNIDDDVKEITLRVDAETLRPVTPLQWSALVRDSFAACHASGISLWGIYPVANPYFMRPGSTFDLRYINGTLWGVINRRDTVVSLDDKEDFERTLLFYLRDGGVLRHSYVATSTQYYTSPGGMQDTRTPDTIAFGADFLASAYPEYCKAVSKKHPEVRLHRLPYRARPRS